MKKLLCFVLFVCAFFISPNGVNAVNIDFEDLFENHQTVMLIIHPTTGVIYYANQAAVDFYGYDKATLLNMKIDEINTLSQEEIQLEREKALNEERNFFVFKPLGLQ